MKGNKTEEETKMKDIKKLNDKDLEQVNGGQVEESVILAQAEKAKEEAAKMKELQSKVITSAGTMSVMIEMSKEIER